MKLFAPFIVFLLAATAAAQPMLPSLQWQHAIGGSADDDAYDIQSVSGGGFITAGSSTSSDGDIQQNKGLTDGIIIKFNALGNIEWQKNYGGSFYDNLIKIKELPGGGYIAAGYTSSNDGDATGLHGGTDIWIIKIGNAGNLIWHKCLGGTLNEFIGSVSLTASGGFIICGNTTSNDGDVSGIHPGLGNLGDTWVVNLDANGTILWQRCYGGSGGESPGIIEQTPDDGFILSCFSSSKDGDVTINANGDYWLVKLNTSGAISWQRSFGGNGGETPYGLVQVADGYVIAGVSTSNDLINHNHGSGDAWMVKVDLSGNLKWENFYGGSGFDAPAAIIRAADGGFIVAGSSESADGNICKNYGAEDYWIFKLTSAGNLQWQKTYGGSKSDHAQGIIEAADGSLFINGFTSSDDNDVTGSHGATDAWLIKLSVGTSSVTTVNISASANNICYGKNITFTAVPVNAGISPSYHWYINKTEQSSATANVFSSAALSDGDIVTCTIHINTICPDVTDATSSPIKIIIDNSGAPADFLPKSLQICEGVPYELKALKSFPSYLWNTGTSASSIKINKSGTYWLEVPYNDGCKSREYINVLPKQCIQSFYFPSAFTPNNDGKNDLFKPTVYGLLEHYKLTIYNRWGQIILTSSDPFTGWDGKWNGRLMETNTFIWTCTYQLAGEAAKTEKGTVTIIR